MAKKPKKGAAPPPPEVTSVRVHMRHVRMAKICARGAREWYKAHDLDWNDFLDNGVPAEVLEATGDPIVQRAVDAARAEHDGR
jgi:hypothetical protein